MRRKIPYRNDYRFFLQPWKYNDKSPQLFAEAALTMVEPEAVIVADGTTVYPLWYSQQIKDLGLGIKIITNHHGYTNPVEFFTVDTIGQIMESTGVYVVSPVKGYCPQFLLDNYEFVLRGSLYEVVNPD